jgi:hypothetical protein
MINITERPVDSAIAAMRASSGRPAGSNGKPADMAAAVDKSAAAPSYTLIDRINEMANRDAEDWRYLTDTLRKFVAQRRADLDYLERLLGTK